MPDKVNVEEFLPPVSDALVNVLATMAGTEARPTPPVVKESPRAKGSVSGIIPLKNSAVRGSLAVTFSKPALLAVYRNMLGEERHELDEEVCNLVGEITNMVAGGANAVFAERGWDFEMASPFLLAGTNHAVHHDLKGRTLLVEFHTAAGGVFLELCFEE